MEITVLVIEIAPNYLKKSYKRISHFVLCE